MTCKATFEVVLYADEIPNKAVLWIVVRVSIALEYDAAVSQNFAA